MRRRLSIKPAYLQSLPLYAASKAVKYFLLSLVGCTLACFVSILLDLGFLTNIMVVFLEHVLTRAFVLIVCLIAIAVIAESLKN